MSSTKATRRPEEAEELKRLLRREHVESGRLNAVAPHLARTIAPVWVSSPYEIDRISDTIRFDTVLLLDAGATTLAENVGAIRRALGERRATGRARPPAPKQEERDGWMGIDK